MRLNFDFDLLGLDGQPLQNSDGTPVHAGKFLAALLAGQTQGDAYKLFGMAASLYRRERLDLDKSDTKTLRDIIESATNITILAKAQLLETIDEAAKAPANQPA